MSILKNFYYYIYIPTSLSPPPCGGELHLWDVENVGKGKEVCNNLFNERILFNGKTVVF